MSQPISRRNLFETFLEFPDISFDDYLQLPEYLRQLLIKRNKILQNDTYNRTMGHLKGNRWGKQETYVLQMRKAPAGYLIFYGLRANLSAILEVPINEAEVRFAIEFYKRTNLPFFNQEMWEQVLTEHNGFLPIEIEALPEGTAILPGDPVMRVTGPGELAAHFESVFHRVFYDTLVATTAHEISRKVGPDRFIEVGRRSTANEQTHLQAAAAMYAGGGIYLTSNDAAVACYPYLRDVGTMGHRYVQHYNTEDEAFEVAIQNLDGSFTTVLLIDLVDSLAGIDKALSLKLKYRNTDRKIWIRLDSGDVAAQTVYALKRCKEMGFTDPDKDKIVVEDIDSIEDMYTIDQAVRQEKINPEKFVIYGAGNLLVTKLKERSQASTGFKLSMADGQPRMKFSDNTTKESLPGNPTLAIHDRDRIIMQAGELSDAQDLFTTFYKHGKVRALEEPDKVRARVDETFKQIHYRLGKRTPLSPQTEDMAKQLRKHYAKQY